MTVFCADCKHVHEKKGPTWRWLCTKHKRMAGEGFVSREWWDGDSPYLKCKDVNHGACPLFEKENTDENL